MMRENGAWKNIQNFKGIFLFNMKSQYGVVSKYFLVSLLMITNETLKMGL
jgi:hypothetical protein